MILFTFNHELQGTLWKGNLARKAHEVLVPDAAAYARRLKQILKVVYLD